jgi:endo-1,4-beta-xylanase
MIMTNKIIAQCISLALLAGMYSCKKEPVNGILNTGNFADTSGSIKTTAITAGFPFGLAAEYGLMTSNATYAAIVKREASSVTFGNELKYSSVVQDNGNFNFTTADNFYNLCATAGLQVHGHTLVWYQQQNANYLKSIAGGVGNGGPSVPNLISTNPGFESGLTGWSVFNTSGGTITAGTTAATVHTGSGSMVVVNPTANAGSQWKVQVSSAAFPTTAGSQYIISYWVKAASAGGSIRLSSGPTAAQYQADQTIGTAWQQVTWTITASLPSTTFLFDMGQAANTYYIDDVSVVDAAAAAAAAAGSSSAVANRVDSVLHLWITAAVSRYAGKIKAWDVLNEVLSDGGALRDSLNTTIPTNPRPTDWFFWKNYLGRDYGVKAFQYAKAADPAALLFINEYGLEYTNSSSAPVKLDSLIAYVKELKAKGAQVDGIGTQMHININTSYASIDAMFQKLAGTGLKIRISEMDVKLNPANKINFSSVPIPSTILASQADMYKYVVNSYIKNVPAAQRYGITVWGVDDKTSWLYKSGNDYPLLFDGSYLKKPAYTGFLQGLKGQ